MDIAAVNELEELSNRAEKVLAESQQLQHAFPRSIPELVTDMCSTIEYVRSLKAEMKGRVFSRREARYLLYLRAWLLWLICTTARECSAHGLTLTYSSAALLLLGIYMRSVG